MFAAHSVAVASEAGTRVLTETTDGDPVLFHSHIYLLSSHAGDAGQWLPAVLLVTPKSIRVSDTIDGCLSLPKFDFPLRQIRYAGVDFAHMQSVFGQVGSAPMNCRHACMFVSICLCVCVRACVPYTLLECF